MDYAIQKPDFKTLMLETEKILTFLIEWIFQNRLKFRFFCNRKPFQKLKRVISNRRLNLMTKNSDKIDPLKAPISQPKVEQMLFFYLPCDLNLKDLSKEEAFN